MMHKSKFIILQKLLIEKLKGRMRLLQPIHERRELTQSALAEILEQDKDAVFSSELAGKDQRKDVIERFLSYDIIEELLASSNVEDIIINSLKPIYVHHSELGFVPTKLKFETRNELDLFIEKLILFSGRHGYDGIGNFELANLGGRVNIIDSSFGPQLTITKAKVDPISIIDLIRRGSLTYACAAQLWVYLEGLSIRPANIIIAGGPGTGKTTLMNALFSFVPVTDRMVVIEDTLELNTFLDDSCSRLEADDRFSLADLVKNSLRMRPERVIIGEVRGEEAKDMITAANIGKYCMSTIHALTAREAIIRLQSQPMNIPEMLVNLMDVFVVLKRYHVNGRLFRVIDEVSETGQMENVKVLLSQVFKYDIDENKVKPVSPSTVYRDRLSQEAGVPARDIIIETHLRAMVLKELDDRGVHTIKGVTTFCRAYRQDPKEAMAKLDMDRDYLIQQLQKEI